MRTIIPPKLKVKVFDRDSFTCRMCGKKRTEANEDLELVIDHVIPVSLGGDAIIENLQTLCRPCNAGKGADIILLDVSPLPGESEKDRAERSKRERQKLRALKKAYQARKEYEDLIFDHLRSMFPRLNFPEKTRSAIRNKWGQVDPEDFCTAIDIAARNAKPDFDIDRVQRYVFSVLKNNQEEPNYKPLTFIELEERSKKASNNEAAWKDFWKWLVIEAFLRPRLRKPLPANWKELISAHLNFLDNDVVALLYHFEEALVCEPDPTLEILIEQMVDNAQNWEENTTEQAMVFLKAWDSKPGRKRFPLEKIRYLDCLNRFDDKEIWIQKARVCTAETVLELIDHDATDEDCPCNRVEEVPSKSLSRNLSCYEENTRAHPWPFLQSVSYAKTDVPICHLIKTLESD